MAQLVFVHGVATRGSAQYEQTVREHDTLFRELLFNDRALQIHSPMWGDTVPVIEPGVFDTNAGLATFALNVGAGIDDGMAGAAQTEEANGLSIVAVGKQDPIAALDAICATMADRAAEAGRPLNDAELAAFRKAVQLIESDSAATLFDGATDGDMIVDQLSEGDGAYGAVDFVGNAVAAVTDRIRNAVSTLGFGAVRDSLRTPNKTAECISSR